VIEQNDMVATLLDVTGRLNDLDIEYMITGSFAMAGYITARTTMDIDVVLEISASDAERFERKSAGDYYVTAESIVCAYDNLSMFDIISNSAMRRDVLSCERICPHPYTRKDFATGRE
jgi:hypothetical protein